MKKLIEWFRCLFFGKKEEELEIILCKKYYHTTRDFEVLSEINKFRGQNGLKGVILNNTASDIANSHIPFLIKFVSNGEAFKKYGHYFAESRSNQLLLQCGGTRTGENLSYGYPDAKSIVNAWIKSEGHRENLLGDYKYIGICSDGKIVITLYSN